MRYCEQCGTPLEDDAVACSNCGAPTGVKPADASVANEPANNDFSGNTETPNPLGTPGDIKKFLPFIIGAAVVVILLCVLLLGGGGNSQPVQSAVKVVNKKTTNIDAYAKAALPKSAFNYYKTVSKIVKKTDTYEDYNDEFKDALENAFDEFEDEYGKNWKISFKQSKKEKLDKDDLEDIQELYEDLFEEYAEDVIDMLEDLDDDDIEDIADELDIKKGDAKKLVKETIKFAKKYKKIKVTAGYELKGKFEIKGKDGSDKTDTMKIRVIKLNGEWMIDYLSVLDGIGMSPNRLMNSLF